MSKTITALRDERNKKLAAMKEILAAEDFTEETQATYDTIQKDVDLINARIERTEKLEAQDALLSEPEPAVSIPRPGGPETPKLFETFDEQVEAVIRGGTDPRLQWRQHEVKGQQQMSAGALGGFMIQTNFISEVLRVDPAATPLQFAARRLPVGSPPDARVEMPALDQRGAAPNHYFGGVTVDWIAEMERKPATEGEIRKCYWEPKEVAARIPITDKLQRNWTGAGSFYGELLGQALNDAIEAAIWNGNGVGQPSGILGHASRIDVARNAAGTIDYDDICSMKAAQIYKGGTKFWLASQSTMPVLNQLANANDNLIWKTSTDNVVGGAPATLEGHPIYFYEYASALGTRGDLALVQMDPYYIIKPGFGPFIGMGLDGNDWSLNRQTLKIFTLIDGNPWLTAPFQLRDGTNVSPFVFLN